MTFLPYKTMYYQRKILLILISPYFYINRPFGTFVTLQ